MRRAFPLMVIGAILLAFLLRLGGVAGGELRGFDSGEYLAITDDLVRSGSIPEDYWGFGQTYPDFPGFMALVGATSLVCGLPASETIPLAGPVLGALCAGAVILMAYWLVKREMAAVFAGLFIATFYGNGASNAISKPSVLGVLLFLLALLLLLRSRRPANLVAACVTLSALVVSHHLSTLFAAAVLGIGTLSLLAFKDEERSLPAEASVVFGLALSSFAFWRFGTDRFWQATFDLMPVPWWLVLASLLLPAALALLLHRTGVGMEERPHVRVSPFVTLIACVLVATAVFGFYMLGTSSGQRLGVWWVYLLGVPGSLLGLLAAFGLPRAFEEREGPGILIWMAVPFLACAASIIYENTFLLPHRPLEYAFPLLAVIFAAAFAELQDRVEPRKFLRMAAPSAIVTLLLLSMPFTVPADELLGGPTAVSTPDEVAGALWLGEGVPPDCLVAADHRTSALVYCYADRNATWYYAQDYISAESFNRTDYVGADVPSGDDASIRAVYLTANMEDGYLRAPWQGYGVMTEAEKAKFFEEPFVAVFQNSGGTVFLAAY